MQGRTNGDHPACEIPLAAKVAFLASPAAHPGTPRVESRETHMAWVFLTADLAYKLKKPVRYPFLDYSTLEARRWICEEEVRLNRRLAPDVYFGTERLTLGADGTLALDGDGTTVDWLVVMRRLPEHLMLDSAILAGTVTRAAVLGAADRLGHFYRAAERPEVDPAAHLAQFSHVLDVNREVFRVERFGLVAAHARRVSGQLGELLGRNPGLVTNRVASGRLVEGHGDLRPEHVCLSDPPVVIDCLEFSRNLRMIDPFDELAFLAMECAVLGAPWVGPLMIERCGAILNDRPAPELIAFYTAYRACFRARQALAHLLEPNPRMPQKWVPLAARYLAQAEEAALRLGLPGARPANRPRGGAG